jgi:hypothetical protein
MDEKKEAGIQSLNDEVDIDQITSDDLEEVSGGALPGCSGCHGIYTPPNPR